MAVSANAGQFITKGSVIARIDDSDAKLRVQEAQANVNQAIAAVPEPPPNGRVRLRRFPKSASKPRASVWKSPLPKP